MEPGPLPPFGQSSSNRAQRRPSSSSSSSKNRPSTAPSYSTSPPSAFLTSTSTPTSMPDSSSHTSSSRTPSLVSSPATSFSSFTGGGTSAASREEILPWESVSTIKQSGPKPTILSSTIVINSKILPPPPSSAPPKPTSTSSTNLLLHPTSPPSSSSRNQASAPPPSNLQRSFSQRPTSLAYNLVTRPSDQPPKPRLPKQQHYAQHPYSNPTSFGAGSTRNFSAPGSSRAGLPPVSILSLAEGASTKGKEKPVPVRHYLVGTTLERDWKVLDQEALLGETMRFELGQEGRNTFVELEKGEGEPGRVLDVGCGLGLWCIEQAQAWKSSHFVGLDLDPVQVDLEALCEIQKATGGVRTREGGVDWEEVGKRVEWVQADFLKSLPFDSGSFDFVHLRWVNLGIPEAGWQDLLEEVARVLKKGTGILEIIETSNTLPPEPTPLLSPPTTPNVSQVAPNTTSPSSTFRPRYTEQTQSQSSYTSHTSSSASSSPSTPRHHTPTSSISTNPASGNNAFGGSPKHDQGATSSQRAKYERHLETHLIQPTASIVVRPALLMTSGLSKIKVVGDYAWSREGGGEKERKRAPGVLSEATSIWAESMFPTHPHHAHSHSPFLYPNPYTTQTAIHITTELHQTYGLEGYAPRAAPGSELKKGAGGRLKKLLSSGSASPTSPPNGQVLGGGGGGKVESWVWVGRKTG